jgi:hypothetical protein
MQFDSNLLNSFEEFIGALLEASTLSKTGMPSKMISAVHKKAEHWERYPRMAHTYRGGAAIPMPYKYHRPSHDIEITEPVRLTGQKTSTSPFGRTDRELTSRYADLHWFLESLPLGENRALIANPELDFYMYIYHKSKSKGATGFQYAILWWDPQQNKAVDFGYSELTTQAVDLSQIRSVHDTKGGNRSDKIQEFVRAVTRDGKDYAPSTSKPLYAYRLVVDETGSQEPRETRTSRAKQKAPVLSNDVISLFAKRAAGILSAAKVKSKEELMAEIRKARTYISKPVPESVEELAHSLGVNPGSLYNFFFSSFLNFRKDLYERGSGAYQKTPGFDLEIENSYSGWPNIYEYPQKSFSPDEERLNPEQAFREAQPEKYRRSLPAPGDYASIPSIIKYHSLDGMMHMFLYYILTGNISSAKKNILGLLGFTQSEIDSIDLPDIDMWLL